MNKEENYEHWMLLVSSLREIAKEKGVTHKQIGERTNMHKTHVSRMFSMRYPPSLREFVKVAQALEVNFFVEDKEAKTNLSVIFERAMEILGRRTGAFPKN